MFWGINLGGGWVARGALLAALCFGFGCSSESGEPPAPTNTLSSARAAETSSTVSFSLSKWLDAEGLEKAAVTGSFRGVTVSLDEASRANLRAGDLAGVNAEIAVDLNSLDTGMEIRNTNVKEAFFDTALFTTAVVRVLGLQATDVPGVYSAKLELSIHGVTGDLANAKLSLEKLDGGYRAHTLEPIGIVSANFNLGVAALLQRCQHKGLDPVALIQADVFVADP